MKWQRQRKVCRLKACDVVGFMGLGAVEVFVVFRFISSHFRGSFKVCMIVHGQGLFTLHVAELRG